MQEKVPDLRRPSTPTNRHAGLQFVFVAAAVLAAFVSGPALEAQTMNRITQPVDGSKLQALPGHHPLWANQANSVGIAPADLALNQLTLVLARSPQQQAAFDQFVADQQNPASSEYHHWLTPDEVGARFGLSDQDIAAVTGWLQSQGLRVNWVAPSRVFIGFGGTANDVGRAFQTRMQYYMVNGVQRLSVDSDPQVPAAIAPAIKGIRGLFTIDERPNHSVNVIGSPSPQLNSTAGNHYLTPADFNKIYNVPDSLTGAGVTIGIVSWSHTNFADFDNFRSKTGVSFPNPTEVVPTAYGGIDPGPALTAPPASSSTSTGGQEEATLDVLRAGSVAPGAGLLLVVSSSSGANDGIGADAQYLIGTTPVPAQVINISFGACESSAGAGNVNFWDSLFQTAAAEGISVFVSSGDSGAAGCDAAFTTPPTPARANSPNYICSSSYATCVGGTQFNDAPATTYWSSTNGTNYLSALSYIPEGAWNQSTATNVAGTGGGVSTVIATPSWQTGTGVPSSRTGRYTPDVSFSASGHVGYFACMAALGASCAGSNSSFIAFQGTSASAPGMAGVAALLDQKLDSSQGNMNPLIYSLAASTPAAFHDATIASSGVAGCSLTTASICNNSVVNANGTTQSGFQLQAGYDMATGLGSLDVAAFLDSPSLPKNTPSVSLQFSPSNNITTAQPLIVTVTVSSNISPAPTGTVILSGGGYTSTATTLSNGYATFTLAAGALATGSNTLTASYTPDTSGSATYSAASGTASVTVTSVPLITPQVYVGPSNLSPTTAESLSVVISVSGGAGDAATTGTVTLTSGTYTSAPANVFGNMSQITIPAQALAVGVDILTVVYTPDTASASIYRSATGSATVTVTAALKVSPTIGVNPSPSSVTTLQSVTATVFVNPAYGYQVIPTGTVTLTSGTYTSVATALAGGTAAILIPAGSLAVGSDTLTAAYTPDSSSSAIYNAAVGSSPITVTAPPPGFDIAGTTAVVTAGATSGNTSKVTVSPTNGFTGSVSLSAAITAMPPNAINAPTFTFATNPVTISSTSAATTTLTITTTANKTTSCVAVNQMPRAMPWYAKGGAVLACVLLLGIAPKRRRWRSMLGMVMLLAALGGGLLACNGGSASTPCTSTTITPGTTAGSYTITVTGTSGSTTASNTITLTVQ